MIRLYLHDWDGTAIGEIIGARNRQLDFGLNKNPSFTFELPFSAPIVEALIEGAEVSLTAPVETDYRLVSVYRWNPYTDDLVLLFIGPVLMARDGGDDGEATASFTCVGPYWRLTKRFIDDVGTGSGRGEPGISITGQRGSIAAQIIEASNDNVGNTWIRAAEEDQESTDIITINEWGGYQRISDGIEQLSGSSSVSGFDWEVEPQLDSDSKGLILGAFKSAPLIGSDKANNGEVVFEYGLGRNNTTSVYRNRSLEYFANKVTHALAGNSPYTVDAVEPLSIFYAGTFEEVVDGDIFDTGLRQEWVDLNKVVRSRPRRLYEIQPERSDLEATLHRVPIPMIDYKPGDLVRAKAAYGVGSTNRLRFDIAVRVYGIRISYSDSGEEVANLSLVLE